MKWTRMAYFAVLLTALIGSSLLLSACDTTDKYPHPVDEDYGGGSGGVGGVGGHGGH
ncbi:hypothetical protein Lbir_2576 [Legionella birminghamensis]|uniref:Lipoprotein n=1 Tax=Legionella birminghamensis TaxID=28083 RepID=A0A378I7X6_9GAMM|nr:hypothetical protein [Legionella birminghamensis]KTC67974.1 hypothetical protein Lbir_2576 [Legionella birminghamensis]STX31317.1 Uncharacterised protein [Legionella birminghamensis]